MTKTRETTNRIDLMFKAFSDKTRLRILSLLQRGECCVGDLVNILRIEQSSASRHLAYLRRAGLVQVRKARQWSYYALAPARGAFHGKLLECLSCCFQEVPQIQGDQLRADKVRQTGGCCPGESRAAPANPRKDQPGGDCCRSES
jgi:ArsR family transcriptional regulator